MESRWLFHESLDPTRVTLSCGNCGRLRGIPADNYATYVGRTGRCTGCGMRAALPPNNTEELSHG